MMIVGPVGPGAAMRAAFDSQQTQTLSVDENGRPYRHVFWRCDACEVTGRGRDTETITCWNCGTEDVRRSVGAVYVRP